MGQMFFPDARKALPQMRVLDIAFTWEPGSGPITLDTIKKLVKPQVGFKVDDVAIRSLWFDVDGYGDPTVQVFWNDVLCADVPAKLFQSPIQFRSSMHLGHPLRFKISGDGLRKIMICAVVRLVEDGEVHA